MNKWKIYEFEKKKLQIICKTEKEYENEIKKLCKKLNI